MLVGETPRTLQSPTTQEAQESSGVEVLGVLSLCAGDPPRTAPRGPLVGPPITPGNLDVPTHMQDWTSHDPRVILISSKVRGPIQLSHGHTQQPGGRAGSRTRCTQPTWSPFPEPSPRGQPGAPMGHTLRGSAQPAEAHLWNPWDRPRLMATSRVAAVAGAGMAAMPLLTCGANNSSGGQLPNQANRTTSPFFWFLSQ